MPSTTTFYTRTRHTFEVKSRRWATSNGDPLLSLDMYDGEPGGHLGITLTPEQWRTVMSEVGPHIEVTS